MDCRPAVLEPRELLFRSELAPRCIVPALFRISAPAVASGAAMVVAKSIATASNSDFIVDEYRWARADLQQIE